MNEPLTRTNMTPRKTQLSELRTESFQSKDFDNDVYQVKIKNDS